MSWKKREMVEKKVNVKYFKLHHQKLDYVISSYNVNSFLKKTKYREEFVFHIIFIYTVLKV